jgi:hypothetical protein
VSVVEIGSLRSPPELANQDTGRVTDNSEVIHLDEERPTRAVEELHPVAATRTERRQPVKLDYFRVGDYPEVGSRRRLEELDKFRVATLCGQLLPQSCNDGFMATAAFS